MPMTMTKAREEDEDEEQTPPPKGTNVLARVGQCALSSIASSNGNSLLRNCIQGALFVLEVPLQGSYLHRPYFDKNFVLKGPISKENLITNNRQNELHETQQIYPCS